METISVHDIPDELFERFKALAERDHRSLNDEVSIAIERLIERDQLQQQRTEALQRIIETRQQIPATDVDSVDLLREDRERSLFDCWLPRISSYEFAIISRQTDIVI